MKKVLSSNNLKIIAILAMVLDHVAYLFIPMTSLFYYLFRIIGRVTAPIMFYNLANGYYHSKNKKKYGIRLLSFALVSQIPFSLFISNKIFLYDNYNILFTLFLGFLCLYAIYDLKHIFLKTLIIIISAILVCFCEYGLFGLTLILMFSLCKDDRWKLLFYSVISFAYMTIRTITDNSIIIFILFSGLFLAIPFIKLYNGTKGKYNLKYLFYIFYPAHLLILIMIKFILG